jgi:uncharacterized protein YegP (UPF0339 family)
MRAGRNGYGYRMRIKPEFYEVDEGQGGVVVMRWRWRLTAGNGQIESAAHQSFASKAGAKRNLARTAGRLLASLARA